MAHAGNGEWLTRQMERRDISVRQLADAMDVTTKAVHDWRGGKTAVSEERVPRLASVLGISEVDARRGLGYWVPNESAPPAETVSVEELQQLREQVVAVLDRIDEIKRGR